MPWVKGWNGSLVERFERSFIPEPNSGCFLWVGAVVSGGYGVLRDEGKRALATHIALRLAGRPLPSGMRALHRCDNPFCVNADHLFIGTQRDNIRDMWRKGRQANNFTTSSAKSCVVSTSAPKRRAF